MYKPRPPPYRTLQACHNQGQQHPVAPGARVSHIQVVPPSLKGKLGAANGALEVVSWALVGAILGLLGKGIKADRIRQGQLSS